MPVSSIQLLDAIRQYIRNLPEDETIKLSALREHLEKKFNQELSSKEDKTNIKKTVMKVIKEMEEEEQEEDDAPPKKKQKTNAGSAASGPVPEYLTLDRKGFKRASVANFKGRALLNLREYYEDKATGDIKPTKKGVTLDYDGFQMLKRNMETLERMFENAKRRIAMEQRLLDSWRTDALAELFVFYAANVGHEECTKMLAESCSPQVLMALLTVEPTQFDPAAHQNLLLRECCALGRANLVQILLEDPRVDPTDADHAAMELALENGHEDIAELLMQHMGMQMPEKRPLDRQGFCSCCEADNVSLFGNKCDHLTCEACSEICGHCMEPVCTRTTCAIPLECAACGQDMVACVTCAHDENGKLKPCDACEGGEMRVHSDFSMDRLW